MQVITTTDVKVGFTDGVIQFVFTDGTGFQFRFETTPEKARLLGLLLIENARVCEIAAQLPPAVKIDSKVFPR